jgi:hypothetical protein
MAVRLLRLRDADASELGINWTDRFLHRHPELDTTWSKLMDCQRVFQDHN